MVAVVEVVEVVMIIDLGGKVGKCEVSETSPGSQSPSTVTPDPPLASPTLSHSSSVAPCLLPPANPMTPRFTAWNNNIPSPTVVERGLETLAVLWWITSPIWCLGLTWAVLMGLARVSLSLNLSLSLSLPSMSILPLAVTLPILPLVVITAYGVWALAVDGGTPGEGGRRWQAPKHWPFPFLYFSRYFGPPSPSPLAAQLIKEHDLDPRQPYLLGYHPHGILGLGMYQVVVVVVVVVRNEQSLYLWTIPALPVTPTPPTLDAALLETEL